MHSTAILFIEGCGNLSNSATRLFRPALPGVLARSSLACPAIPISAPAPRRSEIPPGAACAPLIAHLPAHLRPLPVGPLPWDTSPSADPARSPPLRPTFPHTVPFSTGCPRHTLPTLPGHSQGTQKSKKHGDHRVF